MTLDDIIEEKVEELQAIQAELQGVITENIDILDEEYMLEIVQAKNNVSLSVVGLQKSLKILSRLP
jgi:hypothetical protein